MSVLCRFLLACSIWNSNTSLGSQMTDSVSAFLSTGRSVSTLFHLASTPRAAQYLTTLPLFLKHPVHSSSETTAEKLACLCVWSSTEHTVTLSIGPHGDKTRLSLSEPLSTQCSNLTNTSYRAYRVTSMR